MSQEQSIEVLPLQTKAVLTTGVSGTITGINIRGNSRVTYEIVWWDGRNSRTEWFEEFEFDPVIKESGKLRIGFNQDTLKV